MTESANYSNQGDSNLFTSAPVVVYGSFWERVAAAIIDGIILSIIGYIIRLIFGGPSYVVSETGAGFNYTEIVRASYFSTSGIISIVVYWLYFAYQESSAAQATLGKKVLGLKVTGMQGQRISFLNATGRFFGKYLSAIILCIGYLMMLWDEKRQCLHDKLAGTLVIKSK